MGLSPTASRVLRLVALIEALVRRVGEAVAWLALAMVLVTFTVVVLRYAFGLGWIALQESVTYMHAMLFMLGIAYTLGRDGHVRVDVLYQRWSPRRRAWVDLGGTLLLLAPIAVFMLWSSWGYVGDSWAVRESSREPGGLPGVYLIKTLILLMPLLLLLQGAAIVARRVLYLAGVEAALPESASSVPAPEGKPRG